MKNNIYTYIDFENCKTEEEVINMVLKRMAELKGQGYNNEQVFEIIFGNSCFRNNFLFEQDYLRIKVKYYGYLL